MKINFKIIAILVLLILLILVFPLSAQEEAPVYIIPIKGVVDGGMQAFVHRSYGLAEENNAAAVILEIDTPGGYVWSAVKIRNIIHKSPVATIAFVEEGAISAGALIALVSETLVMAPGSTIGAAEPQRGGQRADAKTLSYWVAQLEAAAEETGREQIIAKAMADVNVEIPGVVNKGELLTLTPNRALELGMIDNVLVNRTALLEEYGLADNKIIELEPTFAEDVVRWITNPTIATLLLIVGLVGLILEIFTIGFGIAGTVGVFSLSLYFFGHMIAGISGFEAILLFILGLILLATEVIIIPGFGIAGIGGIVALVAGIVLAAPTVNHGVTSLVIAILATGVLVAVSIKFLPTRNVWKRLILGDKQLRAGGYNAPSVELVELVGSEGVAITPLRPSGAVKIGDKRIDVVTTGNYIPSGTEVKVVKVEGTRVIVDKI